MENEVDEERYTSKENKRYCFPTAMQEMRYLSEESERLGDAVVILRKAGEENEELQKEIEEKDDKIESLKREIEDLKSEVKEREEEIEDLKSEVEEREETEEG